MSSTEEIDGSVYQIEEKENVSSTTTDIVIGVLGNVASGKSTLVESLTRIKTARHNRELEKNCTNKLGYADANIYRCNKQDHPRPSCFRSAPSSHPDEFPCDRIGCGGLYKVQIFERKILINI